ncbi:uncharacterized protein BO97DRAFT_451580 [Aspergillus homomorphus CBS 101889]|uniref:Polyketide synthase n=1 Tax=Aspergillus homomorphus (strain CBS 101889) TaxID=1450537 RepID=A0A395HWS5_ASPHC|nr:hypothetical protein BO97DRAFT_451580 [Aspergillus homomorphus CBS 101889]RAL12372.1 hypothetical protein BO97DRAFT_451580 [Aspergillus homomorphus CBS 101889]
MRLPGKVRTPEEFWDLLISQRDCSSDVPSSRYNIDAFYHPSKSQSVRTRRGYFLDDEYMHSSDRSFFPPIPGFSGSDLDPQQMQLLEVVWECMENSGQTKWQGKRIGCYVGVFGEDWHELTAKEPQHVSREHAFANGGYTLSNRVSYEFDLKGPSATILTACSSSLTALHEACQALATGSCDSAIVAGTNMLLTPSMSVTMSENMVLSPDGYCKAFDSSANGYGRGEAVNAILIKPLESAQAEGDTIHAIIRGTAVNYDGKSARIFAPDVDSQERLIYDAYLRAGIHDISQTAFVECHGTGTKVGDQVETTAIARAFGGKGVHIGSVKSNVGHGEGASGLTAIIKAVLALQHRMIPPNMHFKNPNKAIPFEKGGLRVPTKPTSWPVGRRARVSVNGFGIGGSNAHVILDAPPESQQLCRTEVNAPGSCRVIAVSARSPAALQSRLAQIQAYLVARPDVVHDLAYTLGARRDHLSHRGYFLCGTKGIASGPYFKDSAAQMKPSVVFTFTGQGAQWAGMGRELMDNFATFRHAIHAMDEVLQRFQTPPTWSIQAELRKSEDTSLVNRTEYSQTLCAAFQIALVDLLASWNISPAAVIGYSSGEVVAAYAAKAISMETAITIAYMRGCCVQTSSSSGAMAVVGLGKDIVVDFLIDGVVVACENSPESVNISGEKSRLTAVVNRILEANPETFTRYLAVEVAYHSPDMKEAAAAFEIAINPHVTCKNTMLPLYSTVTGRMVSDPALLHAGYWRSNLESPVLFSTAVQNLIDQQRDRVLILLEIGPHSTLSGSLRQICAARSVENYSYVPTVVKNANEVHSVMKAVGEIFCQGFPVDFANLYQYGKLLTDLPLYPWDRQRNHWKESRISHDWRFRKHSVHELLGAQMLETSPLEPAWRNLLSLRNVPWLADHRVLGECIFPCAGYIAMVNEAIRQLSNTLKCTIRSLHVKTPLALPSADSTVIELVTTMRPVRISDRLDSRWYEFSISSYDGHEWTKHATGKALASAEDLRSTALEPPSFERAVSSPIWYTMMANVGLQYGPHFQGLEKITADPVRYEASATIRGHTIQTGTSHALHPTSIDQCLQLLSVAATHGRSLHLTKPYIPMYIEEVCLGHSKDFMVAMASGSTVAGSTGQGNVQLMSEKSPVLEMRGVTLIPLDLGRGSETSEFPLLSHEEWRPDLDLLPSHLQLPLSQDSEDTMELLFKAIGVSLLLLHRRLIAMVSSSGLLQRDKAWVQQQSKILAARGILCAANEEAWAQLCSESLEQQWNVSRKKLEAKGLAFLVEFVEITVQEIAAAFEQSPCASISMARENALRKFNDWVPSLSGLSHWLSLLGHSNPCLRILEIGGQKKSLSPFVLQNLASDENDLYSRYTRTEKFSIDKMVKEQLQGYSHIDFKLFNVDEEPSVQDLEENSYDLVIVTDLAAQTAMPGAALRNIRKLLAPGGRLLHRELCPTVHPEEVYDNIIPLETWDKELRHAGFSGVEASGYDGNSRCHLYRTFVSRTHSESRKHGGTIYLLCPSEENHSVRFSEFKKQLTRLPHKVEQCTLGDEIPHGQRVISLLDLDGPFFSNISAQNWTRFQQLILLKPQIIWVTKSVELNCENPDFALVMGVSRTARQEQEISFATLQVDNFDPSSAQALVAVSQRFFSSSQQNKLIDMDYEFALRDGCIHIPRTRWTSLTDRLQHVPRQNAPLHLEIGSYGSLQSLFWGESSLESLKDDDLDVEILYVGLNFRDLMVALGHMGKKEELGVEATGIIRRSGSNVGHLRPGDRVMILGLGSFCTRKVLPARRCARIPLSLSFEDATSMPVVFGTAIYCLRDIGRLEKGQSVLIHAACGGVGLAAIQICQMIGAKIYATVGSERKAQYLVDKCGIPRCHIFSSRDPSFARELMQETQGEGVDIVLNSLAGELLHASWQCVAEFGKMIEIGKRDFLEHGSLAMDLFGRNRAFFGVDLVRLLERPEMSTRLVRQVLNLYDEEKIRPIRPLKVFSSIEMTEAFHNLQLGLHLGKMVIRTPEASERSLMALSRRNSKFSPLLTYFLVGGLGGVGRAIATWMVERGARHFLFMSRSAGTTKQDQSFLRELELQGCTAIMFPGDASVLKDVEAAIEACSHPIGGVLQLSMLVRDHFITEMSHDNWKAVLAAKVDGTWNIHHALAGRDASLHFFVVCGSITGVMGNAGQANYSAANTFVSSFVQYRLQQGLPASAVNLGGVNDVGYLATQNIKLRDRMASASVRLLSEREVLDAFEVAIFCAESTSAPRFLGSLHAPNTLTVGMSSTKSIADPSVRPLWAPDARFRKYFDLDLKYQMSRDPLKQAPTVQHIIHDISKDPDIIKDASWREKVILELINALQNYSMFARGQDPQQIAAMQIDSLMTLEIRNWCRRYVDLELSLLDITKAGTIEGLGDLILVTLRAKHLAE